MKFTEHFKLGSVELGEPIIPLEDSRRFLTIDRQLLGLFRVFGNGVIEGWEVTPGVGLSVNIAPGRGHVNFMAAETLIARTVIDLLPNATNYIYAQAIEDTRFNRNVLFFSDTLLFNSGDMILLAAVVTNDSGVVSVDETVRNDISFIETIKTLINQHRHLGGDDNPSQIDLSSEVSGQLPGFRIDGIDASKITSGRLDVARLPTIEHGLLKNSGVLTHAQLDTFVRNLSNDNVRLLGELSASNLLQAYLALKHIWNEVDKFAYNLLAVIPGITPDSFSDLDNTTALFDRFQHLIQGVPSLAGSLLTASWRTTADFNRNVSNVDIDIKSDTFQLARPSTELLVDGFDNVFSDGATLPGWTLQSLASNSSTTFLSDSAKKADGAFSAELDIDQSFRVQVTKTFSTAQDWTEFNEIEMFIETLSASHGQIRFQILKANTSSSDGLEAVADFLLLNTNETTSGFERVVFDIVSIERDAVKAIRIYTDSSLGWDLSATTFNVDSIQLNNNLFFHDSGALRFRFQTPQQSQWAAISWDGDLNGGTIQARARTAPNFAFFDGTTASTFGPFFSDSGGDPQVDDNVAVEFEIALTAPAGLAASPVIRSVTLSFVTNNAGSGLTIDTTEDFLRAKKLSNTDVRTVDATTGDGQVIIDGRVDVGDVVYGNIRSVQQADAFGTPVVGITGTTLPLSPIQAGQTELVLRQPSLDGVATVIRNDDKTYLITDTLNDRVLLLDRQGNVLKGLASNTFLSASDQGLYPLTAVYNREDSTLYVSWTTNVNFNSIDLSKFTINGSGIVIKLSNTGDSVARVQGRNSSLDSANVTAILLSDAHVAELEFFLTSQSVGDSRIFLDVEPDAVTNGLDLESTNFASLSSARGLPISVAPIKFVRGIHRPISVSVTSAGNWLIGNAKPLVSTEDLTDPVTGVGTDEIVSVLELDPDSGNVEFSSNAVDFSLVTFGNAVEINERYVVMAGIVPDDQAPQTSVTTSLTRSVLGLGNVTVSTTTTQPVATTDETGATTETTLSESDLTALSGFRGIVKTVEKRSGRVVFQEQTSDGTYAADVQVDADGQLVVAEKFFDQTSGKGRVVKMDEDGNIFFQFGFKELSSPNDVRVLSTGNLVISS